MLNPSVDIRDFLVAEKSGFAGSFFVDFLIRLVANNREDAIQVAQTLVDSNLITNKDVRISALKKQRKTSMKDTKYNRFFDDATVYIASFLLEKEDKPNPLSSLSSSTTTAVSTIVTDDQYSSTLLPMNKNDISSSSLSSNIILNRLIEALQTNPSIVYQGNGTSTSSSNASSAPSSSSSSSIVSVPNQTTNVSDTVAYRSFTLDTARSRAASSGTVGILNGLSSSLSSPSSFTAPSPTILTTDVGTNNGIYSNALPSNSLYSPAFSYLSNNTSYPPSLNTSPRNSTDTKVTNDSSLVQSTNPSSYPNNNEDISDPSATNNLLTNIMIKINSTENRDDAAGRYTLYIITVTTGARTWTLARRYREFRALHGALHGVNHHNHNNHSNNPNNVTDNIAPILSSEKRACLPKLPPKKYLGSMSAQFIEERRKQLEAYLHSVIAIPGVWAVPELVAFLEDSASGALGGHIALSRMLARVEILEAACEEAQSRFTAYEDVIASQKDSMDTLKTKCATLEAALMEATHATTKTVKPNDESSTDNPKMNSAPSSPTEDTSYSSSSDTLTVPVPSTATALPPSLSFQSIDTLHVALSRLIPRNFSTVPNEIDLRLDALLVAVQPSLERERMATKINQFIATLLKRSLGAQVFPIGAYPSRTYLDIDAIGLCAFLCLGQERSWFMKVSEVLFTASDTNYEDSIYTSSSSSASDELETPFGSFLLNDTNDPNDNLAAAANAALNSLGYGAHGTTNNSSSSNNSSTVANNHRSGIISSRRNSSIADIARANLSRQYGTSFTSLPDTALTHDGTDDLTNNSIDRRLSGGVTWDNLVTIRDERTADRTSSISTPLGEVLTNDGVRHRYDSNVSIGSRSSMRTDGGTPLCKVRSVSFLSERVKRITAEVDSSTVAITANQMAELCFVALVEEADRSIGKNHLFKRSLLLCRAWAMFDSGYHAATSTMISALHAAYSTQRHSSSRSAPKANFYDNGRLSLSTAATAADVATQNGAILTASALISLPWRAWVTVLLWLFIRRKNIIHHPFQAFAWLLTDLSVFPWDTHALSVHGAIPLDEVASVTNTVDKEIRTDLLNLAVQRANSSNTNNNNNNSSGNGRGRNNGPKSSSDLTMDSSGNLSATGGPIQPDRFQFNYFPNPIESSSSSETGYHPLARVADSDIFHILPENELRVYRKKCYRRRIAAMASGNVPIVPPNDSNVPSATVTPPMRVRSICILDALDQLSNTCESIGSRDGARLKQVLHATAHSLHHLLVYAHSVSASSSPTSSPAISPHNINLTGTTVPTDTLVLPNVSLFPMVLRQGTSPVLNGNETMVTGSGTVNTFDSDSEGEDTLQQNTHLSQTFNDTDKNSKNLSLSLDAGTAVMVAEKNRTLHLDAATKEGAAALTQVDMFFRGCWTHYLPESAVTYNLSKTTNAGNTIDSARYHFIARVKAMANEISIQKLRNDPSSVSGTLLGPVNIASSGIFDILEGDMEAVLRNLEYCSFLLDAEVTAPALLSLASEILSEKGPLPVGEIGKLLQDATSNSSLSTVLKEKFGGLKRFLEGYPNMFILGNDHPFNPHVYRIASLSKVQLANLHAGRTIDGQDNTIGRTNSSLNNGMNNSNPGGTETNGMSMMMGLAMNTFGTEENGNNNPMAVDNGNNTNSTNGKNRRKKNTTNNGTNSNTNGSMNGNNNNRSKMVNNNGMTNNGNNSTMNNGTIVNTNPNGLLMNNFMNDPMNNLLGSTNSNPNSMGLGLTNKTNPLDFSDLLLPLKNNSVLDMSSLLGFETHGSSIPQPPPPPPPSSSVPFGSVHNGNSSGLNSNASVFTSSTTGSNDYSVGTNSIGREGQYNANNNTLNGLSDYVNMNNRTTKTSTPNMYSSPDNTKMNNNGNSNGLFGTSNSNNRFAVVIGNNRNVGKNNSMNNSNNSDYDYDRHASGYYGQRSILLSNNNNNSSFIPSSNNNNPLSLSLEPMDDYLTQHLPGNTSMNMNKNGTDSIRPDTLHSTSTQPLQQQSQQARLDARSRIQALLQAQQVLEQQILLMNNNGTKSSNSNNTDYSSRSTVNSTTNNNYLNGTTDFPIVQNHHFSSSQQPVSTGNRSSNNSMVMNTNTNNNSTNNGYGFGIQQSNQRSIPQPPPGFINKNMNTNNNNSNASISSFGSSNNDNNFEPFSGLSSFLNNSNNTAPSNSNMNQSNNMFSSSNNSSPSLSFINNNNQNSSNGHSLPINSNNLGNIWGNSTNNTSQNNHNNNGSSYY